MFDMINIILRNIFAKPATRLYPAQIRKSFKEARGHIKGIDVDKCIYCGLCQRKCPTHAIVVDKNLKVWEIDMLKCIVCGECCRACPKQCICMDSRHFPSMHKKHTLKYARKIPSNEQKGRRLGHG